MKKFIYILLLILPVSVFASSGGMDLDDADVDMSDYSSIERGAKYYVTYCLGCHSTKHMRYKRIALDLELDEAKVLEAIAPYGANIYDPMLTAMNKHDSTKWFGTNPPDLSLIARSRGADWLYSYLKGFYKDSDSPLGANNAIFKDVGMPNVLWQLQGEQSPVIKNENGQEVITKLISTKPGTMSAKEFDKLVNDLVNFLVYVGEPVQLERQKMGKYVLLFIFLFTAIAYLLKREYWRDIH